MGRKERLRREREDYFLLPFCAAHTTAYLEGNKAVSIYVHWSISPFKCSGFFCLFKNIYYCIGHEQFILPVRKKKIRGMDRSISK